MHIIERVRFKSSKTYFISVSCESNISNLSLNVGFISLKEVINCLIFFLYCSLKSTYNVIKICILKNNNLEVVGNFLSCF